MGRPIKHKIEVPLTKDELVRILGYEPPHENIQNLRTWITGREASQYSEDLVGVTVHITWETDG